MPLVEVPHFLKLRGWKDWQLRCLCYLCSVNILICAFIIEVLAIVYRMQITWWFNRLTAGTLCLSDLKKYQRCFKVLKWEKKQKEIVESYLLFKVGSNIVYFYMILTSRVLTGHKNYSTVNFLMRNIYFKYFYCPF